MRSRSGGRDLDRLTSAAEAALALGLEVWFSPELWDKGPGDTLTHITAAAQEAERLRRRSPDRLVFSVATESTLFMRGIIAGRTFRQRLANLSSEVRAGRHVAPLEAFLARANRDVRRVFRGSRGALSLVKTYAAGRGRTYPDMTWEPKESFRAVADFYSNQLPLDPQGGAFSGPTN
jgi:hypothetical protein